MSENVRAKKHLGQHFLTDEKIALDIVKALNKSGKIKYPKLEEMLEFLCNKKVENYHNAHGDIMATFECYKVLCEKYNKFI
jgi:hypothetical protein